MHASVSQLALVLLLIGRKGGANLLSQSHRVESAKPITFRHSNENRSKTELMNSKQSLVTLLIFRPRMLLAFILIPLLQKQLNIFKDTIWNTHRIRAQKDTVLPDGIPNHIYSFPEEYDMEECGM